jgi:hypothetical protein
MTVPTGNGQARGAESAPGMGSPLPSRPARAAANDARLSVDMPADPASQGGMGSESMMGDVGYLSSSWERPADQCDRPDLMVMGDPGETFGGGS